MKTLLKFGMALTIFALCAAAQAQTGSVPTDSKIVEIITLAIQKASTGIVPVAIKYLSSFMLLQFLITNLTLIARGGELEAVWGKFLASMLWFAFCWYAIDAGPAFIKTVGTEFFSKFAPDLPSPYTILLTATGTGTGLLVLAAALGVVNAVVGQFIMYLVFAILGIGLFFAVKLILLQLELGLIVMMAPFNFAFLGLNATKDQGIAPFKSLMSFMFRVVIYGVLFTAFSEVSNAMSDVVEKYSSMSDPLSMIKNGWSIFETLIAAGVSYAVLLILLYKSDSIAAALTSGSTNLGTADVAGAAAAGAAAGALVGSAASTTPASKGLQLMSDFMKKMAGGNSVGVSNATPDTGSGGVVGTAPSKTKADSPSMSMASQPGKTESVGSGVETSTDASPTTDKSEAGQQAVGAAASSAGAVELGGGTPNQLPEVVAAEKRKTERDAAREQRRQERASGVANEAGIGGASPTTTGQKTLGEHLGNLNHHVAQEKATVSVSVNVNAE